MKARMAAVAALVAALGGCAAVAEPSMAVVEVGTGLEFRVQLATTPDEQRDGLSGRESLSSGDGMLFTFSTTERQQVWMAGMKVPIDAAWIVDDQVLAIKTLTPCTLTDQSKCPKWTSPAPADQLLEVAAGTLDGIAPGNPVEIKEGNEP